MLGKKLSVFSSNRLAEILTDLNSQVSYLNNSYTSALDFDNSCTSSYYSVPETVEQIRTNAPAVFRSQFSLTTEKSYESFIRSNFSNIIQDVKCMSNSSYLDSYTKYFYDMGLLRPQLESRALFNQSRFADSCNFNNVYLFMVPKTVAYSLTYLSPSQKALILDSMQEEKTLTAELVPMDAVYIAFDLALSVTNSTSVEDTLSTEILVTRNASARRSDESIKQEINTIINQYFLRSNASLGQTIDMVTLMQQLLSVQGVKTISTKRTDSDYSINGLQFLCWNPAFADVSSSIVGSNYTLKEFQFPYLFNTNFVNRITVTS